MREQGPHITAVTIQLPDNDVPELLRLVVVSPKGQKAIFCCLWDNVTDSLSGPWATRESTPSLNIS